MIREAFGNVKAFFETHQQQLSHDWPNERVRASITAERRLVRYEAERAGRLAVYQRGGWADAYRIRWRETQRLRWNRRRLVLDPARFSRAVGDR